MEIYKHNTKEKYIFINNASLYIEYFGIEKYNNKLDTDLFDMDESYGRKDYKKLEKKLNKSFTLIEIPTEIQEKTNQFIAHIELAKNYYFVEKNEKNILHSNIIPIMLVKKFGDGYIVHRISSDYEDANDQTILPKLKDFVQGFVASEGDDITPKQVVPTLEFYLNMLYVLGYEAFDMEETVSLCIPKPITKETIFKGELYKDKERDMYYKVAPQRDNNCIQFTNFGIDGDKITDKKISYSIVENEAEIDATLERFNSSERFEKPISEKDFLAKYEMQLEPPKFFEVPTKQEFDLPHFPLEAPDDVIEIDGFFNHFLEENKYYFFANTEAEDPLDWKVSFIIFTDDKEDWYAYSKPFDLKDFNKVVSKPKNEELRYSDDKRSFIKKRKKAFDKLGLKTIATETIFKALSGKSIKELNTQKKEQTFVKEIQLDTLIYDVFNNYACVREDTFNHVHWQFFKDKKTKETWLKTHQTNETKVFENELNFILQHTHKYIEQNQSNTKELRKSYINNPLLESIFSGGRDVGSFSRSELIFQDAQHIQNDYIFSTKNRYSYENKTIVIQGDFVVDGTLFFKDNSDNFIIIKGDLKAKNLIVNWNFAMIYVEGNIDIAGITISHSRLLCENAKTNILLHTYKEALDIRTNFEYQYEVSYYSNAITNKEVVIKDRYNSLEWDKEKMYQLLSQNKPFLADKIENTKTDLDAYYQNKFEKRMLDWGYFYPEYAGCEQLGIAEDNEIKGNCICPGAGDWIVNDLRGKSGTYGISHEDYSMCKLKVKHPDEFGIDYKQKPLKLKVNAEELMNRYIQISMLYMNWAHRTTVSLGTEKEIAANYPNYEEEKAFFVEDPYLALYWLNHFGATLDKRYNEVAKIVADNNLVEKLPLFKEPLAFFKKTDAFYNLKITSKDKDLFLKRRAFLVYWEQVYKNYNPDNLDLWWKSISIYPKADEQLIVRMRWLKNNLKKCNNWSDFETLIKDEPKDIPLLSYIQVCNPNTNKKDKIKYADILVNELFEYKNQWKAPHKKQFGEILLWDIRDFVSDKKKLQQTAEFYFKGNETSKEYIDIQAVLGIKNENLDEVKTVLEKLNKAFEAYDRFDTPKNEKEVYHQKIDKILNTLEPNILLETAKNIKNHELAKRYFVYLWNANIPDKKKALVQLFIYIEFSDHDIDKSNFGNDFTKLIKDENDPNIEIVKEFFIIPEADFRNDYMWENSKKAATMFFLNVVHLPKIFDYLIETISQAPNKENKKIIDAVYSNLFSKEYETNINPILKFSKEQIETMLQTITDWFVKYGYHAEAERSIYYCANPLAEEWLRKHYNNKEWLKQFAHISTFYDPLDKELNRAMKSALEFIENQKHYAYLEFKDEKSHKFWQIKFYDEKYYVTYGKVGTEGRKTEKSFESTELCYKAGDKLVASKLKKGYKKVK